MKYLRGAAWLFVIAFVLVALATLPRQVNVMPPIIKAMYMPGAPRPSTLYCVIYVPPDFDYRYCELHDNMYIVLQDDRIYRTYIFLPDDQTLAAGDLVLLWGDPDKAYYTSERTVLIWQDHFAGIVNKVPLSPRSRVTFVGYGVSLYTGTPWRGWIAIPTPLP